MEHSDCKAVGYRPSAPFRQRASPLCWQNRVQRVHAPEPVAFHAPEPVEVVQQVAEEEFDFQAEDQQFADVPEDPHYGQAPAPATVQAFAAPNGDSRAPGSGKVWRPSSGGKGKPAEVPASSSSPLQGVPGDCRLFVFGMPEGLNADMLRGHFARHGEILDIYIPQRRFDMAYITFQAEEELQDALVNSGVRIAGFTVKGIKAAEARAKGKGKGEKGRPAPYYA